jgi:hypothetical protein
MRSFHFEVILQLNYPEVIAVTETWLNANDPNETFLCRDSYAIYRHDRVGQVGDAGGGVAVLVRNDFKSHRLNVQIDDLEVVCVSVALNPVDSVIICNIYKPSVTDIHLLEPIDELIAFLGSQSDPLILLGDFNLPGVNWNTGTAETAHRQADFLDCFRKHGLFQQVQKPTRKNNILDLVFTSEPFLAAGIDILPPMANCDHSMVHFTVNIEVGGETTPEQPPKPIWADMDITGACAILSSVDWVDVFSPCLNMEQVWSTFTNICYLVIHETVPHTKQKRPQFKRCYPKHIQRLIVNKRKVFRKIESSPTYENHLKFNEITEKISECIDSHERQKEVVFLRNAKADPRQFRRFVSARMKSKQKVPALKDENGTLVFDDERRAEMLNDYYKTVFTGGDEGPSHAIWQPDNGYRHNTAIIEYIHFNEQMVKDALKCSSSSPACGPDNIPHVFLKAVASQIAQPLSVIFQLSMECSVLPNDWLNSIVVPVYKGKGDASDKKNQRPISLTSSSSKVMERTVTVKIMDHAIDQNILTKHQHGFLRNRSTQTQLLECLNNWTEQVDKNDYVDVLYIDIAKAFDTVDHSILIQKLRCMGIRGKLLRWITMFLSHRTQVVKVGNTTSRAIKVTSGVPQGSVLGPLLFLLFINDLTAVVINAGVKIFADDTKIYFKVRNDNDFSKFVYDARKIFGWADKNKLSVAMHKCQVLHVGAQNPSRDVVIGGVLLDAPATVKDLGILMSATLCFNQHIDSIVAAAYQRTGLIFRCFLNRDPAFLKQMFISFCRPKLEFNSCVWSPHQVGQIALVENVQRRYTKRIPGLRHLSYAERLDRLGLKSLEFRRLVYDLCMVYNIVHGNVRLEYHEFFTSAAGRTRGHNLKMAVPYARTNTRKHFFANRVVAPWNSLPVEVVNAPSISVFKTRVKSLDLNNFLKCPWLREAD